MTVKHPQHDAIVEAVARYSRRSLLQARVNREIARYAKAFDESKHPRGGNKENPGQFSGTTGKGDPAKAVADAHARIMAMGHVTTPDQVEEQGKNEHSNSEALREAFKSFKHSGKAIRQYHEEQLAKSQQPTVAPNESAQTQKAVADLGDQKQPVTPPPPGSVYAPDPAKGKAARVGVPGDNVPPPPERLPRLPNLTEEERAVEHEFATMFETDPDGTADKLIEAMANGVGDGPNIFATDEAKMLFAKWRGPGGKDLSDETKAFRSKFNTALHQTANAIAKRAFVRYLDNVVMKLPPSQRQVLVTAGGVAAGKGYAIENVPEVNAIKNKAAATWDSAGEQNSTELPWLAEECKKRKINMTAVYVHANPTETWENPSRGVVERAGKKGRMVDARVFADSYTHGPANFDAFHKQYANDSFIKIAILDNTAGVPRRLDSIPSEALAIDPEKLYARCLESLDKSNAPPAVKEGGAAGTRIWGPPDA